MSKLTKVAWKLEDWSRNEKKQAQCYPVVAVRRGYAEFVAYVYKIDREEKPSLWFVFDIWNECVKRICLP